MCGKILDYAYLAKYSGSDFTYVPNVAYSVAVTLYATSFPFGFELRYIPNVSNPFLYSVIYHNINAFVGNPSTAIINGHPAVTFQTYDATLQLQIYYARSTDMDGTLWGQPQLIYSKSPTYTLDRSVNLKEVAGAPAIVFRDGQGTSDLQWRFLRSGNAEKFTEDATYKVNWLALN